MREISNNNIKEQPVINTNSNLNNEQNENNKSKVDAVKDKMETDNSNDKNDNEMVTGLKEKNDNEKLDNNEKANDSEEEKPEEVGKIKWRRRSQRLLYTGGALCFIYFVLLFVSLGAVYTFQWIWMALGVFFIAVGRLIPLWGGFPLWVRILWKTAVVVGLSTFLIVEGLIFSGMMEQPQPGADYVIVLGAKVNGTTPSRALRYRIEAAYDYIDENPKATIIASGGQGPNEGISEALAISNTLTHMGVDEKRIVLEDESTNTDENLAFSKRKIVALGGDVEKAEVVIVSSDFHIFRAKAIAHSYGYANVDGKSAKSVAWLQPNYVLREFFAILNDTLKGNLE